MALRGTLMSSPILLGRAAEMAGEMDRRAFQRESSSCLVLGRLEAAHPLLAADPADDLGLGLHGRRHPVHLDEQNGFGIPR